MFILGATLWHLCLLERHSRNYIYIQLHLGQIRYSNQVGCARKVGLTLLPLTPSQKKKLKNPMAELFRDAHFGRRQSTLRPSCFSQKLWP